MRPILAVCSLLLALTAAADARTVRGRVVDARSATPIAGAEVVGDDARALTDDDGRFTIELADATRELAIYAAGFVERRQPIGDGTAPLEARLQRRDRFESSVDVTAEAPPNSDSPVTVAVTPTAVMEAAGSADNVFRTLQTLPGVATPEDFSSRLSVRGGTPDQNLTVMDGVEIHNPYRLFGLASAFNPETVDSFELTTGGFGAKYGDRLSSLLTVDNRFGQTERSVGGSASLSITDANLILEGPLAGGDGGSWLLTGRRTYYDVIAGAFLDDSLPAFSDAQLKAGWDLNPSVRLSVLGLVGRESSDFGFDDEGERADFVSDGGNDLASVTLEAALTDRVGSRTILSWYRNSELLDFDGVILSDARRSNNPVDSPLFSEVVFDREIRVRDLSLRQDLSLVAGSRHLFESGFELHELETEIRTTISGDRNPTAANGSSVRGGAGLPGALDSTLPSRRFGAWLQDRIQLGSDLTVVAGMRYDWDETTGEGRVSPRLAATYDVDPKTRLTGAFGIYSQSPGYEKLLQSDYLLDYSDARAVGLTPESSTHVVVGLERDLGGGMRVRAEGYWKRFDDIIVGMLESDAEIAARLARYDFPAELRGEIPRDRVITSNPSNDASGRAYGADLYLTKRATSADVRLTGWLTYTWGKAEREAYGRTYAFEYDRRHAATAVVNYRLSDRFRFGLTARYATGFPYTPVERVIVSSTEDPTDPSRLIPERDGDGFLAYASDLGGVDNLHTARLPDYARLDARFTWSPGGASGRWELYLEALNVTNRDNAGQLEPELVYDPNGDRPRVIENRSGALPFLPTIGARFRF